MEQPKPLLVMFSAKQNDGLPEETSGGKEAILEARVP
jgi:hypothetical protein